MEAPASHRKISKDDVCLFFKVPPEDFIASLEASEEWARKRRESENLGNASSTALGVPKKAERTERTSIAMRTGCLRSIL